MDEAKREEEYYRRLRIWNYIVLADIYFLAFFIMAIPLSDFNHGVIDIVLMYAPAIYIVVGLFVPRLLLRPYSQLWYSVSTKRKIDFVLVVGMAIMLPAYAVSMLLAIYVSMPDFLMASPQLIIGGLFISIMGPVFYFVRKWHAEKERKKYGEARAVTLKSDGSKAREVVESTLNSMKLQYREEKIGSKWEGFRDSYVLDSGLRITAVPISTIRSLIRISNISDDDTLEKQIEREILRRLPTSQP